MRFKKQKSFGPRIRLTESQEAKLIARVNAAGLTCSIEQCETGSVYVAIDLPTWQKNIAEEWFHDLDCGCGDGIAKIRLSGHDEGRRQDSTHCCVGSKSECLAALNRFVDEIIAEHGAAGLEIIRTVPVGVLGSV